MTVNVYYPDVESTLQNEHKSAFLITQKESLPMFEGEEFFFFSVFPE